MSPHFLFTHLLLAILLFLPTAACALDWEGMRSQMQESVGLYAKIAGRLGNPDLAARARRLEKEWSTIPVDQLAAVFASSPEFDFARSRIQMALDIDRLQALSQRLEGPLPTKKREPVLTDLSSSSCGEIPEAECLLGASGVTQEDLAIAVTTTNRAAIAVVAQKAACREIAITPITTTNVLTIPDPLACVCESIPDFVCGVACEGFTEGEGVLQEGGVGGSATSARNPASIGPACKAVQTAALVAAQAQQTIATQLACWKAGRVEAIYEGMEVLQCLVEQILDLFEESETILIGDSLHRKGGSRPAILYLEKGQGGNLDKVREILEAAIEKTAGADYVVSDRARKSLEKGDFFRSFGDVKRAFDHYRRSYQQVTISSQGRNGG